MMKRFTDHGAALKFGREFSREYGVTVLAQSVYLTNGSGVTLVFGPSSAHLAGSGASPYTPAMGWYFSGAGVAEDSEEGRRLLALAEAEPVPYEAAVQLVNSHTINYTPAERREIAAAIVANRSSVWHESNAFSNRKNGTAVPCQCGRCNPKPAGKMRV